MHLKHLEQCFTQYKCLKYFYIGTCLHIVPLFYHNGSVSHNVLPHLLVVCDTFPCCTRLGTYQIQIIHTHYKNFKSWYVSKIKDDLFLWTKGSLSWLSFVSLYLWKYTYGIIIYILFYHLSFPPKNGVSLLLPRKPIFSYVSFRKFYYRGCPWLLLMFYLLL